MEQATGPEEETHAGWAVAHAAEKELDEYIGKLEEAAEAAARMLSTNQPAMRNKARTELMMALVVAGQLKWEVKH